MLKTKHLEQLLKSGATTARFYNKQVNEMWNIINRLLESDTRTKVSTDTQLLSSQQRAMDTMNRDSNKTNTTRLGPKREAERKRVLAEWNKNSRKAPSRRMVSFFARKPKVKFYSLYIVNINHCIYVAPFCWGFCITSTCRNVNSSNSLFIIPSIAAFKD